MLQKKSCFINYDELDETGCGLDDLDGLEDYENGIEELEYDEEDY